MTMRVLNAPEVSPPHATGTLAAGDANPDRDSLPEPYQRPMQTDFLYLPTKAPATRRLVMPAMSLKSPYVLGWIALGSLSLMLWVVVWFVPGLLVMLAAIALLTWALMLVTRAPVHRPLKQGTGPL